MSYNPDIKYQTDGVVSILEAPDPTFDPTYGYVVGDEASADSWYGFALVKFFPWTPTLSGTVDVSPPADDGEAAEMHFYVFQGDAPPLSGAASPTRIADAKFVYTGTRPSGTLSFSPDRFDAVGGTAYTFVVMRYTANYDNNFTDALIPTFSVHDWILATQPLGGQAVIVPWRPVASGLFSCTEGYGTVASGNYSHAEGQASTASGESSHAENIAVIASGAGSHAEGRDSVSSGNFSHAEGEQSITSGEASHAEGLSTLASGDFSHAEGEQSTASGQASHAEGVSTLASHDGSHAEGLGSIASSSYSHAEGDQSTASGPFSHAEGSQTTAGAVASHAEGHSVVAAHLSEHAHGSGKFVATGDAQYSRFSMRLATSSNTPASLLLGPSGETAPLDVTAGDSYAVDIELIASREDVAGTLASWHIRGLFTAAGGALRRVGSLDVLHHNDADASTWAADVVATGANIDIQVTGENAKTIRWVATVHSTKVGV